jgi:subtilisin family serine protease
MRCSRLLTLLALTLAVLAMPLAAGARPTGSTIYLRRASFDPLVSPPAALSEVGMSASTLRLVQLDGPPDAAQLDALRAVGMQPLFYIPDNTFLVRASAGSPSQAAGLRWSGVLPAAYKFDPSLADGAGSDTLDLRVVATPDADPSALTRALTAIGGTIRASYTGLTGLDLSVRLPRTALAALAARDDVVWVEPYLAPQLLNDAARDVIGVTAARQELSWLNGAGQIIAVTDTGLDRSTQLSADFSGRVAATFTPHQMYSGCTSTDWSDYNGHGTHVSGSILGSGLLSPSGSSFAGMAPGAQLVVESSINSGMSNSLDCLPFDSSFLQKAYDAGARVQNASWGFIGSYGGYTDFAAVVDDFLYQHPEHLLVVAAGNSGVDANSNGVIDADSITSPATAKNVLAVGASENNRPSSLVLCYSSNPLSRCWSSYVISGAPISTDFVSNNPAGMAAFSSRGPADDGRIKPDLVAPGTNVLSARSHASGVIYPDSYDSNYAYESGTSMATPIVSGAAALVRQWLSQARGISTPSAALVRALLLNGAQDLSPGQYGTGATREIPAAWPNSVEGWGRVNVADSVDLSDSQIVLHDDTLGLSGAGVFEQRMTVGVGQPPLRVTLTWTDYPGSPLASKALVNDLDLEVVAPDGSLIRGNASADLISSCRSTSGADRCNTSESVNITAATTGTYTLRVRGASVAYGPQRFALVARSELRQHVYLPLVMR